MPWKVAFLNIKYDLVGYGLNPVGSLGPHSCSVTSYSRTGERLRRAEIRKLVIEIKPV